MRLIGAPNLRGRGCRVSNPRRQPINDIDQRVIKLLIGALVVEATSNQREIEMAKKTKKKIIRREYTKADVKELRAHSKARTPLATIVKLTKRTEGSLRQKALKLGIGLGHQR
jgi:hypothetical protein